MSIRHKSLILAISLAATNAFAGGSIIIVNGDGAGEGFNDATAVAPEGGNTGTTLGQQRLNVFEAAAAIWETALQPDQIVRVLSNFDPLACTETTATLGSAGAEDIFRDFPGAPFSNTWYHSALAEHIAQSDLNGADNNIGATFNSTIDEGTCLNGSTWYYGLSGPVPEGRTALFPVVLHELGHGLGFSGFSSLSSGALNDGRPDVFTQFTRDLMLDQNWSQMDNSDRQFSATNDPAVVWTGNTVTNAFPAVLDPSPSVTVNAPGGIAGDYPANETTAFARIPPGGVTRDVVLLQDGQGPDPNDGCEPPTNTFDLEDQIVLVNESNECSFAQAAINLGAGFSGNGLTPPVGLLVAAMDGNQPADVSINVGNPPSDFVPTFGITNALGNDLIANIGSANVTMGFDASRRQGTISDAEARGTSRVAAPYYLRLHAPGQLEPGSSVFHWTTDASPNLLMEPELTDDQFDTLDLSTAFMSDIGWGGGVTNDLIFFSGFEFLP